MCFGQRLRGTVMTYDSECAKLATHFLAADAIDRTRKSLAQHIQDAVEEWFHAQTPEASEAEQGLIPIPDGYAEQ